MNISEQIRAEADKQRIPIAKLERDLGFNHGTIRRWENSEPSVEKVVRVADYLNVSIDQLCERSVEKEFIEEMVKDLTKQSPDEAMLLRLYQLIPEEYRMDALYAVMEIKMKHEKK